ncbi:hypothetical protein [Larkinella ripae]
MKTTTVLLRTLPEAPLFGRSEHPTSASPCLTCLRAKLRPATAGGNGRLCAERKPAFSGPKLNTEFSTHSPTM